MAYTLSGLQQRLQYTFVRPEVLQQALTHRSFAAKHNERLEFLGDAVLDLVISAWLFERLQELPEGELSRMRANLVRQETLCHIAQQLPVADLLRLGEGEIKSGGRQRPSILANALEAIIGAVYLDGGFEAARTLVLRLFADVDLQPSSEVTAKDSKTALQEWLQARRMQLPVYHVMAVTGQAHQQTFEVECVIEALSLRQCGAGGSRRAAEQAAAAAMLSQLN